MGEADTNAWNHLYRGTAAFAIAAKVFGDAEALAIVQTAIDELNVEMGRPS